MSFGESVFFNRGVTYDDDGDPVPDSGSVEVEGCIIDWSGTEENTELARNGMGTGANIFIEYPPAGGVPNTDTVTIRGFEFDVIGRGAQWVDPEEPEFGGLVVTVRRNEG